MKLSIVIPVYNEAPSIKQIIQRVVDTPFDKELIIVDDASTDGTNAILQSIKDPRIRVFRHDRNLGKGASLRTGFSHVSGDIIIVQDADLEYHPRNYKDLITPILDGDADVVYGSRFLGGPHRVLFVWHYLGNLFLTSMANLLYNVNLSDMETGYKAFRREVIDRLSFKSNSFDFEVEFTAKVVKNGFRLFETPVSYAGRTYSEGKKISWRDGVIAIFALIKYRFIN